ncbi:MAG TPA: hypothetical protein P5050_11250 [Bacteroidia bacterium]|nr:hypothetical protein [Bacteroidia bacterium]HRS59782.1 hypothetical protein [Bacteroidia bacterium]HRU68746.1 hypothetical protein [Bacteroidia bacterium]
MKIFEKELYALSRIFFENNYPVFVLDPGGSVKKNFPSEFVYLVKRNQVEKLAAYQKKYYLINVSGANTFSFPLNFQYVEAIISFSPGTETSMDFYHKDLYYFQDEYKRINWIVSENHRVTDFFHDLDKARSLVDLNNFFSVFPYTWKYFMLKLGNVKKFAHGRIQLMIRQRYLFESLSQQHFDSYSVQFSKYQDGIVRFRFYDSKKTAFLIKKAWNTEGKKKLEHEYELLSELQDLVLTRAEIPVISRVRQEYLLEFRESFGQHELYKWNSKLYVLLEEALHELSASQRGKTKISKLWRNENLHENLVFIKSRVDKKMFPNGLSIINFVKIYTALVKYFDESDPDMTIESGLSVRKIVPDNIGRSGDRVIFNNFEHAETFYPLFFDSFDFIFHAAESPEQPDSDNLIQDLEYLKHFLEEKGVLQNKEDFELQLKVFLLIHIIPEMVNLLTKPVLPPEENLKLLLWADIIDYINETD